MALLLSLPHPLLVSFAWPRPDHVISVYHVNPLHEGVVPVDMDTADLHGDIFFDLHSKTLPIECSPPFRALNATDCANSEVVDDDLVVTKLSLTVKGGRYGEYGRCNVCLPSGIDPFSHLSCTPGEYFCTCGPYFMPYACNHQRRVGAENITKAFGGLSRYTDTWGRWIQYPWSTWGWPVVGLTGGMWYSTTSAGWCDAPGADPLTCTWRAAVEKVVNKSCSDEQIYAAVEAHDAAHDGCFSRCPAHQAHPHARNTSDVCWIYCFYATVLGRDSLVPGGRPLAASQSEGMPLAALAAAFERPFAPEAQGGCPAVPVPAGGAANAAAVAAAARRQRIGPSRYSRRRAAWLRALYAEVEAARPEL